MTKKIVFALMFVCCMAFAGVSLAADAAEIKELEIKANQGDAESQFMLGYLYDTGDGVKQDYTKARQWYEKAAAQEYVNAQGMLGVMYELGVGVERNITTAKEWFKRACDNGDQRGCDAYSRLNK